MRLGFPLTPGHIPWWHHADGAFDYKTLARRVAGCKKRNGRLKLLGAPFKTLSFHKAPHSLCLMERSTRARSVMSHELTVKRRALINMVHNSYDSHDSHSVHFLYYLSRRWFHKALPSMLTPLYLCTTSWRAASLSKKTRKPRAPRRFEKSPLLRLGRPWTYVRQFKRRLSVKIS